MSAVHISHINAKRIEAEDTDFHHQKINIIFSRALCDARIANKMTQVMLANKINQKKNIIVDYELGNAIPNCSIIRKLNTVLNVTLPRIPKVSVKKESIPICAT